MGVCEWFIRMLDDLLRLPADRVEQAAGAWSRLRKILEGLPREELARRTNRVLAEVLRSGAKFERSVATCRGLGEELRDLARLDLERLKEDLLAIRDLVQRERSTFAGALLSALSRGALIPAETVIEELLESGVLSASLSVQLRIRRDEVAKKVRQADLVRIAGLLVQLRRLRDEKAGA